VLPAVFRKPQGQFGILKGLHLRFKIIDFSHDQAAFLQIALVLGTEDFFEQVGKHACSSANDVKGSLRKTRRIATCSCSQQGNRIFRYKAHMSVDVGAA
jgi:hypothetical protein